MDMPADFTLNATLPPTAGKGAVMSSSVMPGYQSGQRLASSRSAMVSCGEALIWTLRCTIAILDLPLSVVALRLRATAKHRGTTKQASIRPGSPPTVHRPVATRIPCPRRVAPFLRHLQASTELLSRRRTDEVEATIAFVKSGRRGRRLLRSSVARVTPPALLGGGFGAVSGGHHRLRVRPRCAAWVARICSAETPKERTHDGSRDKTQVRRRNTGAVPSRARHREREEPARQGRRVARSLSRPDRRGLGRDRLLGVHRGIRPLHPDQAHASHATARRPRLSKPAGAQGLHGPQPRAARRLSAQAAGVAHRLPRRAPGITTRRCLDPGWLVPNAPRSRSALPTLSVWITQP